MIFLQIVAKVSNAYANPDMNCITIDEINVSTSEIIEILRRNGQIPFLVRDFILDKELNSIHLGEKIENELIENFRRERNLISDAEFNEYLTSSHLNEELLKKMVTRPEKIVRYREERWGPRAQSLYLKYKDSFDLISYRRLQCSSPDVMQEVYFRLKDGEETWESLGKQFHPDEPDYEVRIGPVPVSSIEKPLLEALRKSGEGVVVRPLMLQDQAVVAELESFQASRFDEELKQRILRQEFETWLEGACSKMLSKTSFPK